MPTKTRSKTRKRKTPTAVVSKSVPGLAGVGLVRIGSESRLELRDRLQMPRVLFGRVVNVSERTIAKVEATAENVDKLQRPYNEMYRLYHALGEVVDPETLGAWFITANEAFDGLKPIEVIERGDAHRLWDMIYRLRSGIPG